MKGKIVALGLGDVPLPNKDNLGGDGGKKKGEM